MKTVMPPLTRESPGLISYTESGTRIELVAVRPRRRDFLKVLRGKWTPEIQIRCYGIGQFHAPDAPYPKMRSST